MRPVLPRSLLAALAIALAVTSCQSSCRRPAPGVDLLELDGILQEVDVAGRDRAWFEGQTGKHLRINDVVRRVMPGSPPSRIRYRLDLPEAAQLSFAAAVAPDTHHRPGVEFVVKVKADDGREQIVWQELVNPLERPKHRRWVDATVDLSRYAGAGRELIFETRGFEQLDDPRRAFWGTPAVQSPHREAPIAIVYLVDTLRADHTSVYGYERDTTPRLAEFAKDAVVFDAAIAHASWTKPSVASLMTSLLPGRHRAVQLRDRLDAGHVTLAEMMKAKGFSTGAAIANSVIYGQGSDFEQGFDFFAGLHGAEDRPSKVVEAAPVVDTALDWLMARRGLPSLLYVHTMDPHVPYTPPAPFDRMYEPHPIPGHPGVDPRSDYKEPLDRERMIAQYDGEIAYGDREFGRFIDTLKKRGLYDRALIVFMADHGEEFLDHGKWLHGRSVFDELIRIPLVVKFPGGAHAGTRVAQQVQEVDVFPTVLRAMELDVPGLPTIQGLPLQSVVDRTLKERPAVSEISHRGIVAHGLRTGADKYVERFSPEEDQLYFDLAKDPREQTNLAAQSRERVRRMQADLQEAMVTNPFRHNIRATAPGTYDLYLKTGGWIEGLETAGLGIDERASLEGNKRKLAVLLKPKPGQPREVAFTVRPRGAPIWLEGTRDGRPLRPSDVFIAEEGRHPAEVPLRLPEIEPLGEDEAPTTDNIFAPPRGEPAGLNLWLTMLDTRGIMEMSKERCEELRALGYVGGC